MNVHYKKILKYLIFPLIVAVMSMFLVLGYTETHEKFVINSKLNSYVLKTHLEAYYLTIAQGNIYKMEISSINDSLFLLQDDLKTMLDLMLDTNRNVNNFIYRNGGD